MQVVKRVEIVIDTLELDRILALLDKAGVSGYTVIRNAEGKGHRGIRSGDDLTSVFQNSYVLTTCSEEQLAKVVAAVQPVLKRIGGVCLVSNALWVMH